SSSPRAPKKSETETQLRPRFTPDSNPLPLSFLYPAHAPGPADYPPSPNAQAQSACRRTPPRTGAPPRSRPAAAASHNGPQPTHTSSRSNSNTLLSRYALPTAAADDSPQSSAAGPRARPHTASPPARAPAGHS